MFIYSNFSSNFHLEASASLSQIRSNEEKIQRLGPQSASDVRLGSNWCRFFQRRLKQQEVNFLISITLKQNNKLGDKWWQWCWLSWQLSTMVSILASGPSCHRFHSWDSWYFSKEKIVTFAEVNQCRCLEDSGQWLENVDWTHLVQASGKLVIQKKI